MTFRSQGCRRVGNWSSRNPCLGSDGWKRGLAESSFLRLVGLFNGLFPGLRYGLAGNDVEGEGEGKVDVPMFVVVTQAPGR